jgi:type III secretion protein C
MPKKAFSFFSYKTIVTSLCFLSITAPGLYHLQAQVSPKLDESISYTMNFKNIAIVEYIRFVSKISKINFIFNETDLNFPVTLVSDQPVSAKNLFSALAQVLEVNGFTLSEQEGSILITKNPGSSQLAPLNQLQAPLITRIFKISNINLSTLTQIVRSVVSKGALVESVVDTNQIIVTDTGPNLDRLGMLIQDLDTAGSNLKLLTYKVKNQSANSLSNSLKEMIKPFQGGNNYLVIAQNNNNQLLIISTPYLIQQTEAALLSLDVPEAMVPLEETSNNVFLYTPQFKRAQELNTELLIIAETLKNDGAATASLVSMIENVKTPIGNSCLLFTGSSATFAKIKEFLNAIDNKDLASTVFIYHVKNLSAQALEALLNNAASSFEDKGDPENVVPVIDSMVFVEKTNTIIFSGTQGAIDKIKLLLSEMDLPTGTVVAESTFAIFELKNVPGNDIIDELKNLEPNLNKADSRDVVACINSIKWLKSNNSLLITGSAKTITTVEELITKLDVAHSKFAPAFQNGFAIYHLKSKNGAHIADQLHSMGANISAVNSQAKAQKSTLDSAKYLSDTNTIMLSGDQESIQFAESIIAKLDVQDIASGTSYAFFHTQGTQGTDIVKKLHQFAKNLSPSNQSEKDIQSCIADTKYIPESHAILIHGTEAAIQFTEQLAQKIQEGLLTTSNSLFVVYNLKTAHGDNIVSQLHAMALNIPGNSQDSIEIKACLETVKYLPETNSIMITGPQNAINFTQSIVEKMDVTPVKGSINTFYLYRLESAQGDVVINKLQDFAEKLPSNTAGDKNVIISIDHLEWVKESNSILITGNQATIDRVSALIAQYDSRQSTSPNKGDFLIYSPHYLSLETLEQSLEEYAVALKQTGLADPNLIETINTAKAVPTANHLVFSGNPDSINKLKTILNLIDQASPQSTKSQIGQTTFYVYQLKYLTPEQFESAMRSFVTSFSKFSTSDALVTKSVDSMQYLKETNSFLFSGTSETLDKIAQIASKIDIGQASISGNMTYEIYTPQNQDGEELIAQMCQFAQGLSDTGVQDQSLYDTINNIKWISKSKSMIITGSPEAIQKVQDLLKKFDIPGGGGSSGKTNMGFMVYKLQYHSGTDIQSALNKLAPTFATNGPNPNPGLQAAISSMQWIQATNSLVASGEDENLQKLKTLISEIDMPLKQVFIEVLVVETDTANTQNFGLQWFGRGQIKNQLGFGTGNFGGANPLGNNPSYNLPNFSQSATSVSTKSGANAGLIPFYGNQSGTSGAPSTAGFDLGVIGDILFHKGQSFVSLGSLVNALQADADSTIVMNPKIISQDNQNSTIFIGQNIPFLGSSVTNSAANTTTTQNIEYRDVGINLSITPKLGDDNVITLEITYSMSAQTANTSGGQGGFNGIQTTQTNMTTRVHVPDQHFVVLSGMLSETKARYKTGLPCLGGLPLIGVAFSDNERNDTKNNTLIFIRPCIVHSLDDLKELTEKQENKYRDMLYRHQDKEDFDTAINLVKEPENE